MSLSCHHCRTLRLVRRADGFRGAVGWVLKYGPQLYYRGIEKRTREA
jgi:hypothetical protein